MLKYISLLIFMTAMYSQAMEAPFFDLVKGFEEGNDGDLVTKELIPLKKRPHSQINEFNEGISPLKKIKIEAAKEGEMMVEQIQFREAQHEAEEMIVEYSQIRELQYEFGIINQRSRPKNIELAYAYFLQAANNGHPEAQHQIGKMYQHGNDIVRKDPQLAIYWYTKAINQGNSRAAEKIKTVGTSDYLSALPTEILLLILQQNGKVTCDLRLISPYFQNLITSTLHSLKGPRLVKTVLYKDLKPFFNFINTLDKVNALQLSIRKNENYQTYWHKSEINTYLKYNKFDDYLLQITSLTSLSFSTDSLNSFAAKRIAEVLRKHKTLTSLDLGKNTIKITDIAEALTYNTVLTELNLSYCNIHDEGATFLWKALQKNTTLKSLNICSNYISISKKNDQKNFSEMLCTNTSLTSLNLKNNNFCTRSLDSFAPALRKNTTLTYLNLNLNNINIQGQAILHNIQGHSETLETLKLDYNVVLFEHWDS